MMAVLAFLAFATVAFFTQRAAHWHTAAERAAYEAGAAAGSEVSSGAKLPYAFEMNEVAQKPTTSKEAKPNG